MTKFFLLIITCSSVLFSCSNSSNKKETEESVSTTANAAAPEEEEGNPNMAILTQAQMTSIGVTLGVIEQKQLTDAVKVNGVLKVPNQNKASVNSIYSGVIRSLSVQPGSYISKGQTIATIANPEFIQAQSQYLNIGAEISLAQLEVNRQKELNAGNAGSLKNLQAAETKLRTLRTARSTYAQQIQLMGINPASIGNGRLVSVLAVRSPISGVVSNVNVKMGSYVDVSTVVAEMVDNSQLHLDLFVYEKDLPKLKNNQTIHFTVTNNPGKEYDAEIYSLGSSFEGDSKAVSVHAKVKGEKTGLIDGMNVTAIISLNQNTVPAVPSEAIVNVGGQDYIFVLDESAKENKQDSVTEKSSKMDDQSAVEDSKVFERIPIAKGISDVGFTQITLLKEIPGNAKIVTKGAFFVSAKMTNVEEE